MPNPSLSDAMQEAYATAAADAPIIDTLSIYYDGLVDEANNPDELYLFSGANYSRLRAADGVPLLDAKIEASAARHAGGMVEFIGIPFEITLPDVTTDQQPRAMLTIDNVGQEMIDLLVAASQGGKSIEATYRSYLAGSEAVGPENDPPLTFKLVDVKANGSAVTARLVTLTIGGRRFPFQTYTNDRFPTLQYA